MSWRDVGFLVLGLFVGTNLGLMILALCAGARRGDELARMARLNSEKSVKSEKREIRCFTTGAWPSQELMDDALIEPRVIYERKVVVSKRLKSRKPKPPKKPPVIPVKPDRYSAP